MIHNCPEGFGSNVRRNTSHISAIKSVVVVDLPCFMKACLAHCLVSTQAPYADTDLTSCEISADLKYTLFICRGQN